MNKNLILFLLFSSFFSGCSLGIKKKGEITSVDLNLDEASNNSIQERKIIDIEDNTDIGSYGPGGYITPKNSFKKEAKTIAVIITPGLYRSLLSLDILKCFEMNAKPVNVISGIGFSAIIATMYAQGMTSEEIRWKIFNHIRSEDEEIFSRSWIKSWDDFIEKNINQKKVLESSTSLWMPVITEKKIVYRASKIIGKELASNYNNNEKFILDYNYYDFSEIAKIPADIIVIINTMGKELNFKEFSNLKVGIYGKVFSYQSRVNGNEDKIKVIEVEHNSFLDDETNKLNITQVKNYCLQIVGFLN